MVNEHWLRLENRSALQEREYKCTTLHVSTFYVLYFAEGAYTYIYVLFLLHIDMTHELKILLQVRPGPIYST